jgi:uncharacterized protein (TIGR00255 family)
MSNELRDAASPAERGVVRSMTGFGRAESRGADLGVRVEVRSVNARHLKLSCRAPSELDARLHEIEALVRERLDRGTITLTISLDRSRGAAPSRIDAAVFADYAAQAVEAAQIAGLSPDIPVDAILRLPGVLTDAQGTEPQDTGDGADWETTREAVGAALAALIEMRTREGASMEAALRAGADAIEQISEGIRARVPGALVEHQARLRERLDALLGDDSGMPDEIVAREAAVLSEKTDVAEELERLASHVAQWRETLDTGGPIGRRLEFLTQELGREANTIGSKSADPAIRDAVIDLKLEIDRLKEQAANVE